MSWLARLGIDAEAAYAQGIVDRYAWHKKIWDCFPGTPDAKRDYLTRIDPLEKGFRVWIMGRRLPQRPSWCSPDNFEVKEIADSFFSHRLYVFDLHANPTKCLSAKGKNSDSRKSGKRVPLIKPEMLREWLNRKAEAGGFNIQVDKPLEIGPMVENHFRKDGHAAYHGGVNFRGVLEVVNHENFVKTYHAGIGSAKSFGFGLLLLAPINL